MKRIILALLIGVLVSGLAWKANAVEEYPDLTILDGEQENAALRIDCDSPKDGIMQCRFTQIAVRKAAKDADLKKALAGIDEGLKNLKGNKKQCDGVSEQLAAFQTGIPPESVSDGDKYFEKYYRLQGKEKADTLKFWGAMKDMVCRPTRQNIEKSIRVDHEQKMRTCKVSTHLFEQKFKKDFNTHKWVNTKGPAGDCGIIDISTFETDQPTKGISPYWTYKTRKVITNKEGKFLGLASCSGFDEAEYTYSWKASEKRFVGCDYIEFSP